MPNYQCTFSEQEFVFLIRRKDNGMFSTPSTYSPHAWTLNTLQATAFPYKATAEFVIQQLVDTGYFEHEDELQIIKALKKVELLDCGPVYE